MFSIKIEDIGSKYLGLLLSKLIKLNYLLSYSNKIKYIGSKYLGLSRLIKLFMFSNNYFLENIN